MHIFLRIMNIYLIKSPKIRDWDWKMHHRASKMTFWTCNMSNWAVFPQKKRYQTFRNKATGTPPSPPTLCAGICRCIPLAVGCDTVSIRPTLRSRVTPNFFWPRQQFFIDLWWFLGIIGKLKWSRAWRVGRIGTVDLDRTWYRSRCTSPSISSSWALRLLWASKLCKRSVLRVYTCDAQDWQWETATNEVRWTRVICVNAIHHSSIAERSTQRAWERQQPL